MNEMLRKKIEEARKLYTEEKYADAVSIFSEILKEAPDYIDGWKYLGSSLHILKRYQPAIDAYEESIKLNFINLGIEDAYSWRELGNVLVSDRKYDEAKRRLEKAQWLDEDDPWLWRYYARLYRDQKQYSKEIMALLKVELLEVATPYDLCLIGIAFHNNNDFFKALNYYYKSLIAYDYSDSAPLLNMALVYSHPDVSQDIDAADSYQRVLIINPALEEAKAPLKGIIEKLTPLAQRAKEEFASLLIGDNDHYRFYINPFEAFDIQDFDVKLVHRARKKLLSEIELNGGRVSWLSNQLIDKSHVYRLEEEIVDNSKREYHWIIYNDKKLLNFLSKGAIELFLYDEAYLPDIILTRESDEGFRVFLSSVFTGPYDFVLSRALEKKAVAVIKALFDGRRWVVQSDRDKCFVGAQKLVCKVVADFNNVSIGDLSCEELYKLMEEYFRNDCISEIFNLLPVDFHKSVSALITRIRELAIDAYNKHNDSESSRKILQLCKLFRVRNPELAAMLDKDFEAIEKIIVSAENEEKKLSAEQNEEKKLSISLPIKSNSRLTINRQVIQYQDRLLKIPDIEGIQLMAFEKFSGSLYTNGIERCGYKFVFRGRNSIIDIEFSSKNLIGTISNLFRSTNETTPVKHRSNEEQRAAYELILDSINRFVVPVLEDKLLKMIEAGGSCSIGHCGLNKSGIMFTLGMILSKAPMLVPWEDVIISHDNGKIIIASETKSSIRTSLSVGDTENAILFPNICQMMKKRSMYGNGKSSGN
ncbi:MAG: tetratricopeptide repeat protein [Elusimicrobiota bacterium]